MVSPGWGLTMFRLLDGLNDLHEIIGAVSVLFVCGLAIAFGGRPHRLASLVLLIEFFGAMALSPVLALLPHSLDIKAALVLIAYAVLTVRWPDRWLILLTGLQGFAVLLRLAVWIDPTIVVPVNGLLLNVTGWLMLAVLGGAAIAHMSNRRSNPAV